uniref:YlxR domain-containing protein n=1 Tax=Magnetococcus massalia (strain MO-1) TaxID=451514 RepID=A0A1S7LPP6_MAGMO|nr:Conserved protein of unknown function. Putative nucleic-acid-binding protein implicated in transcription termination [Candidatus Magnetococcus massalia]
MRTCAVTRQQAEALYLIRFVVAPDGQLMEDLAGKLPGRGLHILPQPDAVTQLLKRKGLVSRLASGTVTLPVEEQLHSRLERALERRLMDALGLARRAGALIMGLREVEERIARGERPWVIMARDTAEHTVEKTLRLVQRPARQGEQALTCFQLLDRDRLGAACGRGPMAVLGIAHNGVQRRIRQDAWRWLIWNGFAPSVEEHTEELE